MGVLIYGCKLSHCKTSGFQCIATLQSGDCIVAPPHGGLGGGFACFGVELVSFLVERKLVLVERKLVGWHGGHGFSGGQIGGGGQLHEELPLQPQTSVTALNTIKIETGSINDNKTCIFELVRKRQKIGITMLIIFNTRILYKICLIYWRFKEL